MLASSSLHPMAVAGALSQAQAEPALHRGPLRTLFQDLVGRPPFESERATWSGKPKMELVEFAIGSEEFWANWMEEQLYYFLLIDGFRPPAEGVRSLPGQMTRGDIGAREVLHRI